MNVSSEMSVFPDVAKSWSERCASPAGADFLLAFGKGSNGVEFAGAGWSTPEPGETWSIGGISTLALPAPPTVAPYVMVLRLRPHVAEGLLPRQRLIVSVNGTVVGQFSLSEPGTRACAIPQDAIDGQPGMQISFHMPDAARPADVTGGSDKRLLGIAFSTLKIYPDIYAGSVTGLFGSDSVSAPVDIDVIAKADRISVQDLMLRFESLGQNCEFGLAQRQCHAEPVGLLRFSSAPLPKLLTALEARFDGMGQPDSILVEVSSNGREFMINDRTFGFLYHAFVETGAMSVEDLHRREVRRVPFLVSKLLEDLEEADKIFVFKGMGAVEKEEVFPLAQAIRRYGPNTLLFVTLADDAHPAGLVEAHAAGFLVGYITRFAPSEDAKDLALSEWVKLCRTAYRFNLAMRGRWPT